MIQTHAHSDYSTLDGCCTVTQRANRAVELGQFALALTDHGNVNGIPSHIKACEKAGIQPLLGMEAYYRADRFVEHSAEEQYNRHHIILIAQNLEGWHNLVRLSSESYRSGFYQDPCVDDDLLDRHSAGLLCTSSCVLSPFSRSIQNDNGVHTQALLERFAARYPGRFWLEIQPGDFDLQRMINIEMASWGTRLGIPLTVGIDSHYDVPGKATTQKIMTLVGINTTVAEAAKKNQDRLAKGLEVYELGHEGLHMMGEFEVADRFAKFHPQIPAGMVQAAIAQTDAMALSVLPFSLDRHLKMPRVVKSQDEAELRLREWCRESMDRLGLTGNQVYEDQLEYELGVIRNRKNSDYIYLIGLIVRWARSDAPLPATPDDPFPAPKRPIRVGSARGSGGGSLVLYLSRITGLDPIAHKLKFERFLNADRKGLPDIDVDFPSNRRNEVKEFVARLLGRDKVADIAAFGRFTARAAIKDTARMMGIDGFETKKVTDLIDPVHDEDLTKLVEVIPQLKAWATKYPEAWNVATDLENHGDPMIKNVSKHAAGVLMMPTPVNDQIPTIRSDPKDPTERTAWSETPRFSIVDEFGLVKGDLLSIQGLEQQDLILARVALRTGEMTDLDELPFMRDPMAVEPAVMEAFQRGWNLGINQFEGGDVTQFMRRAQPRTFTDLAAINALYRPGPMGSGGHEHFARRLNQQETYEIPEMLEAILGDTYGVLAFQEQVMGLFEALADYTPSQADDVRKIISKLYREKGDAARQKLNALREEFIIPATAKIGLDAAENQWMQIPPYSGYSFNRAHASGYSAQGVQDMWQKVHYPADFYSVLMTLEPKKAAAAVKESKHFGMKLGGPDVNISQADFTVEFETNTLRFGLEGINGVGEGACEQVLERAPYESVEAFNKAHTFKYSKCNAGHRKALLESGALDSIGGRSELDENAKAALEFEYLGLSLRPGGTFGVNEAYIESCVHSQEELEALDAGANCVVAGVVTEMKQLVTKKGRNPGQHMGRLTLRFGLDSFSVTLFPNKWSEIIPMGTYMPNEHGEQSRAGQPCTLVTVATNGPQWVRFDDDYQLSAFEGEFVPLLQKDRKLIIRGKRDDRAQVIANGVMDIDSFITAQRNNA